MCARAETLSNGRAKTRNGNNKNEIKTQVICTLGIPQIGRYVWCTRERDYACVNVCTQKQRDGAADTKIKDENKYRSWMNDWALGLCVSCLDVSSFERDRGNVFFFFNAIVARFSRRHRTIIIGNKNKVNLMKKNALWLVCECTYSFHIFSTDLYANVFANVGRRNSVKSLASVCACVSHACNRIPDEPNKNQKQVIGNHCQHHWQSSINIDKG